MRKKTALHVFFSYLGAAGPKQHIKDNVNGDGSETDMIMQLLQQHQLKTSPWTFRPKGNFRLLAPQGALVGLDF